MGAGTWEKMWTALTGGAPRDPAMDARDLEWAHKWGIETNDPMGFAVKRKSPYTGPDGHMLPPPSIQRTAALLQSLPPIEPGAPEGQSKWEPGYDPTLGGQVDLSNTPGMSTDQGGLWSAAARMGRPVPGDGTALAAFKSSYGR